MTQEMAIEPKYSAVEIAQRTRRALELGGELPVIYTLDETKQDIEATIAAGDADWRKFAACTEDTAEYFYSPDGYEPKEKRQKRETVAKYICDACPVRRFCLDRAQSDGEWHGMWGGQNELERRKLLRAEKLRKRSAA